jgi:hypothetical protein
LLAAHAQIRDVAHAALAPRPTPEPRAAKIDAWRPRVAELIEDVDGLGSAHGAEDQRSGQAPA